MVKEVLIEKTAEIKEDIIIEDGISFCPICERTIPAQLIEREGYVYEQKKCPWCNESFELLLTKAPFSYQCRFSKIPNNWPRVNIKIGAKPGKESDVINLTDALYILFTLTQRCNSECRFCFDATSPLRPDMDIKFIKNKVKEFKNKIIVLFGGEPTLREDLPSIIRTIVKSRNIPLLYTNGIKLADIGYVKLLKKAGLKYVCLSLDAINPVIYEQVRGLSQEKVQAKLKALKNLRKENIPVVVQTIIVKGVNDYHIKDIIDYIKTNPSIRELWLRPLYLMGKEELVDFDKSHLMSGEEIKELVEKITGIDKDYFNLWDDLKKNLLNYTLKLFPNKKLSMIELDKIYTIRQGSQFVPLLNKQKLEYINYAFASHQIWKLLKPSLLLKIFPYILRGIVTPWGIEFSRIEDYLYKKGIFKFAIRMLDGVLRYPDSFFPNHICSIPLMEITPEENEEDGYKIIAKAPL